MNRTISKERVAVKSGYYFEIFNKNEIPDTLVKYDNKQIEKDGIIYDLYHGKTLEDEKRIDAMFGDRMGHFIDSYAINKEMESEEKMKKEMSNVEKRQKPKCALIGEDGNIFNLMGIASRTLKRNGMREESTEMCNRITSEAKSYDEALMIIDEYVEITSKEEMEEDVFE